LKSALFVDFDNVYSGLRKLDPSVAQHFAQKPQRWMSWLVDSLQLPDPSPAGARRRVLVRRCYLNPQVYQRFRPPFNLAGFEIIDCPALTSEGKTSTDIHMVLDIIDLLQHDTRYDEFIVFSADADFTPVLRKLRRWDRRTTVLAIGFPSAAYRASADLLIDQDEFVREALGFRDEDESAILAPPVAGAAPQPGESHLAQAALELLTEAVADSAAPLPLARLAATILASVDGMDAATWAGFGSFRGLVESWSLAPLLVSWEGGGVIYDPRRHRAPPNTPAASAKVADIFESITNLIRHELAEASQAVPCSRIASLITAQHTNVAEDWNGMGSFRRFLDSLNIGPLKVDWNGSGGRIYDPRRHTLVSDRDNKAGGNGTSVFDWGRHRDLLPLATQIHDVISVPLLSPADYRVLFKLIASDLVK